MPKNLVYSMSCDQDIITNYIEICIDPDLLNNYSNEEGLGFFIARCAYSEELQKLRNELLEEVIRIIDQCLTKKQKEVMRLTYIEGKTQNEISEVLGKHQSCIHKTIKGNLDYTNNGKRYGGAIKKIKKICSKSEKIQGILLKMREENYLWVEK